MAVQVGADFLDAVVDRSRAVDRSQVVDSLVLDMQVDTLVVGSLEMDDRSKAKDNRAAMGSQGVGSSREAANNLMMEADTGNPQEVAKKAGNCRSGADSMHRNHTTLIHILMADTTHCWGLHCYHFLARTAAGNVPHNAHARSQHGENAQVRGHLNVHRGRLDAPARLCVAATVAEMLAACLSQVVAGMLPVAGSPHEPQNRTSTRTMNLLVDYVWESGQTSVAVPRVVQAM